jgi:signal transduction histidine kinase
MVYDPVRDRVVFANDAAIRIAGYTPRELRAMSNVSERLIDPSAARDREFLRALSSCRADEIRRAELSIVHNDGLVRRATLRAVPIELSGGCARLVLMVAGQHDSTPPPDTTLGREALAVLGHELRNPLSTLRHAADLLRQHGQDGDVRRLSSIIDRQTRQLARLVETLLDVSKIESGKLALHLQTVDVARLARDTTEAHQPLAEKRGIVLRAEISEAPLFVQGDAARLGQVLDNLLHNALKFTDRGSVEVRVHRRGDELVLEVRDTGVGIPLRSQRRLFEADGATDPRRGGLGLGLPLVKGIVNLHGGTIEASSRGPDQGTRVVVRLPACEPITECGDEPVPASRGTSVLVIEDDRDAAELLEEMLQNAGHRVFVAHDGAAGVALARAHRPDVILCDIGLPEMSGYEVVQELRGDPDLRATPMVALTGYAQPEDRKLAHATGFDEHLPKPVELSTLRRVIARLATS